MESTMAVRLLCVVLNGTHPVKLTALLSPTTTAIPILHITSHLITIHLSTPTTLTTYMMQIQTPMSSTAFLKTAAVMACTVLKAQHIDLRVRITCQKTLTIILIVLDTLAVQETLQSRLTHMTAVLIKHLHSKFLPLN
jgi:hypothetical protein